jgi:hypothetical protein
LTSDPSKFDPFDPIDPLGGPSGAADADPPIPDELVDRFFDREISPEDRARLAGALDENAGVCERMARISRAISMMRRGVRAPDQSEQILDRLDRIRGFVPASHRPFVRLGRLAVAAAMFGVIAGAVIVRRQAPEIVEIGGERTLVRDVARAAEREAAGVTDLARVVRAWPRELGAGARVETAAWGVTATSDSVDTGDQVTWSLSPVAACSENRGAAEYRMIVVVGGRVVAIEREDRLISGSSASVTPISFKPRPAGRCVRDARLSDLP